MEGRAWEEGCGKKGCRRRCVRREGVGGKERVLEKRRGYGRWCGRG